jgi:hypothetical protein
MHLRQHRQPDLDPDRNTNCDLADLENDERGEAIFSEAADDAGFHSESMEQSKKGINGPSGEEND